MHTCRGYKCMSLCCCMHDACMRFLHAYIHACMRNLCICICSCTDTAASPNSADFCWLRATASTARVYWCYLLLLLQFSAATSCCCCNLLLLSVAAGAADSDEYEHAPARTRMLRPFLTAYSALAQELQPIPSVKGVTLTVRLLHLCLHANGAACRC